MCQDNPEGPSSLQTPMGSAQVVWSVIQFDPSLCLTLFISSGFHSVGPKGNPDTHPSTKLHLSLHPGEPAATHIRKHSSIWGGFLLKTTGYTCTYNIKKKKTIKYKMVETRTFCVNVVTFGLKFTILCLTK